jgi:hypothetical protein
VSERTLFWYQLALWSVAIPATFFPFLYTAWFKWWESTLGRALFIKSTALAVIVDITLLGAVWGLFYPWLTISLLYGLAAAVVYQQYAMLRVKMSDRRRLDGVPENTPEDVERHD